MVPLAIHEKALADKDAMEEAIRHEADPDGNYSRLTLDTAGLVKWIKKGHRDALKDNKREKDAIRIEKEEMQLKHDGEKLDLNELIFRQSQELRTKEEQREKASKDLDKLDFKHKNLLEDNEAKRNRITELEEEGHVLEMHEKLLRLENAKEELAEKEDEIKHLKIRSNCQEQQIRNLEIAANKAKEVCDKNMSDEQKSLRDAEAKIGGLEREVKRLSQSGQEWESRYHAESQEVKSLTQAGQELESGYHAKSQEVERLTQAVQEWESGYETKFQEIRELKIKMSDLEVAQRNKLVMVEAKTEGLQATINALRTTNESMENDQHDRGSMVDKSMNNSTLACTEAGSLVNALKAANARANALQISTNALEAENGVLRRQQENATSSYDPQVQEQVERLENENQSLRDAAKEAKELETQLVTQFREAVQKLEERFTDRSRELETGFNQGFEDLCGLRDQWLQQKQKQEQEYYRKMVAADAQYELERQIREDQFTAIWKDKEQNLQRKEDDLQSGEDELAKQVKNLYSSGENLAKMKARAEKAEEDVDQLKKRVNELQGEVKDFQDQVVDMEDYRDTMEAELNNEVASQRRDAQRHLDLLNEEIDRMDQESRAIDLHSELQIANCCMSMIKYQVANSSTNSEALNRSLYGADFSASDVRLLEDEGRPVLLAQLQAAKSTLDQLRSLLAGSPEVEVDRAISILTAPRGDEDAAQPAEDLEDFFGQSTEHQQQSDQQPPQPSTSRKRSEPPLGAPSYGEHEDNAAHNEWGDQEVLDGARISTAEEISNRKRYQLKSRPNKGRAKTVPLEHIDPVIRDQ